MLGDALRGEGGYWVGCRPSSILVVRLAAPGQSQRGSLLVQHLAQTATGPHPDFAGIGLHDADDYRPFVECPRALMLLGFLPALALGFFV
jgi:hypothetical protein